ncbi:MAG: hypothetical protein NVSMB29_02470 [Candidatus Dormibacteria bacterium]
MAPWRSARARRRLQLVCAAAGVLLGIDLVRWATIGAGEISRSDFPSLDAGGILLARGGGAQVYDPVRQAQVYQALIRGAHSGSLPFNHAPLSALLYAPFSGLPLTVAYHAFGVVQLLCLLGGCLLALRAAPWPAGCSRLLQAAITLAALAGAGTLPLILQGQDAGLIALAVGAAYLAWRRDRAVLAGAMLAFAGVGTKPHLLLGLLALVAARRDLRLWGGVVAGTLTAAILSAALVGTAGCVAFARLALFSSGAWPSHWFLGLPAVPTSLFGETPGARVVGLVLAALALGLAAWLGSRWRESPATIEMALGGAACLSLAAAVHLLGHDLVILSPLLVAVAARTVAGGASGRRLAVVLGGWGLLLGATAVDAMGGNEAHFGRATPAVLVVMAGASALSVRRSQHRDALGRLALRPAG